MGLGRGSATYPPTHPTLTPPRGGGGVLYPTPTVTYKHWIEKPPLAIIRRNHATPFGCLLSPIPQKDLLAVLMKCITERAPHQHKRTSLKTHCPLSLTTNLRTLGRPKTQKKRAPTRGGEGGLVAQNARIWGNHTYPPGVGYFAY